MELNYNYFMIYKNEKKILQNKFFYQKKVNLVIFEVMLKKQISNINFLSLKIEKTI